MLEQLFLLLLLLITLLLLLLLPPLYYNTCYCYCCYCYCFCYCYCYCYFYCYCYCYCFCFCYCYFYCYCTTTTTTTAAAAADAITYTTTTTTTITYIITATTITTIIMNLKKQCVYSIKTITNNVLIVSCLSSCESIEGNRIGAAIAVVLVIHSAAHVTGSQLISLSLSFSSVALLQCAHHHDLHSCYSGYHFRKLFHHK